MEFAGTVNRAMKLTQEGRAAEAGQLLRSKPALHGLVEHFTDLPPEQWVHAADLMANFHATRSHTSGTPQERAARNAWHAVANEGGDALDAVEDTATAVDTDHTPHAMTAGTALGALLLDFGRRSPLWPFWADIQASRLQDQFEVSGDRADLQGVRRT